jgi:hypothetical protein
MACGLPHIHRNRGTYTVSQKTAQLIIGRILTEEELREQFVLSPAQVLQRLRHEGHELTDIEVEALANTDSRVWTETAPRIPPRLQRCRFPLD